MCFRLKPNDNQMLISSCQAALYVMGECLNEYPVCRICDFIFLNLQSFTVFTVLFGTDIKGEFKALLTAGLISED